MSAAQENITDRLYLGQHQVFSMDDQQTGLNNNVLVVGCSGSGKTMSVGEPFLLHATECSLVVSIVKRELLQKYTPLKTAQGYRVLVLDTAQPEESTVGYDPLEQITDYEDVPYLAQSIVEAGGSCPPLTDEIRYWNETAAHLLSAEMLFVMLTKEDATFADVLAMHNHLEFDEAYGRLRTNYDEQFLYLEQQDPDCPAVRYYRAFCRLSLRTAGSVYGTLQTALQSVFTPGICRLTEKQPRLDFERLATEKTVLFIVTSPVNPAAHCFANLMYGQMFKQLFEFGEQCPGGVLPVPVHLIADDFAVSCRVPNFAAYTSVMRQKHISVTLMLQSEAQLTLLYGPLAAATIISNCDSRVYMGGMQEQEARNMALRLGLPVRRVLELPVGQAIVVRRGQKPVITARYPITEDPLYRGNG